MSQHMGGIPYWSDRFTYQGLDFTYTMVGTDPRKGSATTNIPVQIIPFRFIFPDGTVFDASTDLVDGKTPVDGMVNSPVFQNHDYVLGGTDVGNTQFGDAFQRANFWNSVSTSSPDYHVLLGQPSVLRTQVIQVPAGKGEVFFDPSGTYRYGHLDGDFTVDVLLNAFQTLPIDPDALPIFATGPVFFGGAAGFHDFVQVGSRLQPFIINAYVYQGGYSIPDSAILSHEIGEWLDNPLLINNTPGWDFWGNSDLQCNPNYWLEVADPLETEPGLVMPITENGTTSHVVDLAFIDFFTRDARSRSVNGQYYMFHPGEPTAECVGQILPAAERVIDFPGSRMTEAGGVNDLGIVVGFYRDQGNVRHSFLNSGDSYFSFDPPGSTRSSAYRITNNGLIFGTFNDATGQHGYIYNKGSFQTIDFPSAAATVISGGNSRGDAVGGYFDSAGNLHGFIYSRGRFTRVDAPFGDQTELTSANDRGEYSGLSAGGALGEGEYGLLYGEHGLAVQNMPGALDTAPFALNNSEMTGGIFINQDGYEAGYFKLFDHFHSMFQLVLGNNNLNEVAGADFDPNTGKIVGFVASLPIHDGKK